MKIGIPKEIKQGENRVALPPSAVKTLVDKGHEVLVETEAGQGSGFEDQEYRQSGAVLISSGQEIYAKATLIVKVKEPLESEYPLLKQEHILFTYLHLAASEKLTKALLLSKCTAIAYESVQLADGSLPLLIPMSEVAGRMATQQGAWYLEKQNGGRGVLLGGVSGIPAATVVIIGGGTVGLEAARMAAGLGASVWILEINAARIRYLKDVLPANVQVCFFDNGLLENLLPQTDLLIGAVLVTGAKAPILVSRKMVASMPKGAVIIDVAVDQGGTIETIRPTSHAEPIFIEEGVLHYGVPNMPGAVPFTSTKVLSALTLPYIDLLATFGKEALDKRVDLAKGLQCRDGRLWNESVATQFGIV
jgi:alanine dehydrogenase